MNKSKGNLKRENITIADIRSKYTEEKINFEKNNLWGYFVLRRISFYLAWLFIRLGISANKVTGIAIIIGCIGYILLGFGGYSSMIVGALILNIWALLEFVDGTVARATNSSSNYGAFIDNLNAYIMSALLFIGAGVGAFRHPDLWLNILAINIDKSTFLFLGGWTSLFFYIFPRLIGEEFINVFSQNENDLVEEVKESLLNGSLNRIRLTLVNITGAVTPLLLIAVILHSIGIFIFFYALISTGGFIILITKILRKARGDNSKRIELFQHQGD